MGLIELNIAAVVTNDKKRQKCDIFIPSHGISAHGSDFIEAMTTAIATLTAIYHYDREHCLAFPESIPLAQATQMCKGKSMFSTYIPLEV